MVINRDIVDVVYVIGQLVVGGTERQLLTLIEHHNRSRFRPTVVCLSESAPLAASLRELNCPTYILERNKYGRARAFLQTYQIIRSIRPGIVHSFDYAGRAGIPAGKFTGVPCNLISIRTQPGWQMTLLDRGVVGLADLVIANSQRALSELNAQNINDSGRYKVIHNGIDVQAFDSVMNTQTERSSSCKGFNNLTDDIICVVATLRPVKRLEILLQAFSIVLSQVATVQLWIIGDGPSRDQLETMTDELDIRANVKFWGMCSNVPTLLKHASIGVLCSEFEGLSNALIEYMAAGLPVVATEVGGTPELVIHDNTGFLVPPNDAHALANSILFLLHHPTVACKFGAAGRQRINECFTIERMVDETEAIYEEILNRKGS